MERLNEDRIKNKNVSDGSRKNERTLKRKRLFFSYELGNVFSILFPLPSSCMIELEGLLRAKQHRKHSYESKKDTRLF